MTKRSWTPYFFLFPWLLSFFLFWAFPFLYSLYISFTKYDILTHYQFFNGVFPAWAGLANYRTLWQSHEFWNALKITSIFVAGTLPITLILALILAFLLNKNGPLRGFLQSVLFLPAITSVVVAAILFRILWMTDGGLDQLLRTFFISLPANGVLNSPSTALPAVMAVFVWTQIGYDTLLFLAALQTIPAELYEAAEIDGAGFIRRQFSISLPLLNPMIRFVMILHTIRAFQVFVEVLLMTTGGPIDKTTTLVYLIYETGFRRFDLGLACAMSYVLFGILVILTLLQLNLGKEKNA